MMIRMTKTTAPRFSSTAIIIAIILIIIHCCCIIKRSVAFTTFPHRLPKKKVSLSLGTPFCVFFHTDNHSRRCAAANAHGRRIQADDHRTSRIQYSRQQQRRKRWRSRSSISSTTTSLRLSKDPLFSNNKNKRIASNHLHEEPWTDTGSNTVDDGHDRQTRRRTSEEDSSSTADTEIRIETTAAAATLADDTTITTTTTTTRLGVTASPPVPAVASLAVAAAEEMEIAAATTTRTTRTQDDVIITTTRKGTISSNNNMKKNADTDDDDDPQKRVVDAFDNEHTNPSYKTLLIFAMTTVIIWLSEPLLSLVDTTVVGWSSSSSSSSGSSTEAAAAVVTQLASLGPATTLTDSLLYSTYGLSIATTNRIAAERAVPNNERQLQRTVSHVLGISVVLGGLCTLICWTAATPILTRMAGGSGTVELLRYATAYTRIRSAVAVAAVGGVTLQSICLAQQDVRTPALAVLAASVTNLVGDLALRRQGVIGAAVATAAASLVSATILFRSVRQQFLTWRGEDAIDETVIPMVSWPDRNAAWQLLKLAGPIFFVIIAKIFCYGAMTLRCTEFGVAALAAQSILMRVFFFFACFGDAFSQTAQSFLPATLYPTPNRPAFAKIFRKLLWLAALGGLVNSQVSRFILQRLSGYLTSDATIVAIMQSHGNHVGLSLFFHAFIMLLEGVVLASRDFTSLLTTYSVTVAMHYGMLTLLCGNFTGVWQTFVVFQITRLALYAWRVVAAQQDRSKHQCSPPLPSPLRPDESTTAAIVV